MGGVGEVGGVGGVGGVGEKEFSQLLITNYPLPITNYQLPITNYPLPIPLPLSDLAVMTSVGRRTFSPK